MSDLFDTLAVALHNLYLTSYALVAAGTDVAQTFVWGQALSLWATLDKFAHLLGASADFVLTNIVILVVALVALAVYRAVRPSKRGSSTRAPAVPLKKRAE